MIATLAQTAVSLTQSIEMSLLTKATIILALGLVAAWLAARARASVRHLILSSTFMSLIALPLAAVAVPSVALQMPIGTASADIATVAPPPPPESSPMPATRATELHGSWRANPTAITSSSVVRRGWIVGFAALVLSLAIAVGRLHRFRRAGLLRPDLRALLASLASHAGVRRSVGVLEHQSVVAPLTCGLWSPVILLPLDAREWTEADLRRALVHELEHVKRRDWSVEIAARVACACYWFHPLAWVALRQLRLEAERACDDAVVRDEEGTEYANQLVVPARRLLHAHTAVMLGMANRSDLSTRVNALLDERQRRGRAGAAAAASAIIAASVVVLGIAPVRAIATSEPTAPAAAAATGQNSNRTGRRTPRARGLDRALYEAAESGDLNEIDQLLQAGANVNAAIEGDGSALIAAARRNRLAVVRHLLDRGADPNMPVEGDGSPLIVAASEGAAAVVALLLDRGALVDLMVPEDENPLIQASARGHLDIVKLLVARGADVHARAWAEAARERPDGEWRTPLSMARRGGHAAVVAFLVSAGARE